MFIISGFGSQLKLAEEYLNLSAQIDVASVCNKPWDCGLPSLSNKNRCAKNVLKHLVIYLNY